MKPDQLPDLSMTRLILSDPVLLVGSLLLVIVLILLLYFPPRGSRVAVLTAMNDQRWKRAQERTERMIALVTEIRDHLARIAPPERP